MKIAIIPARGGSKRIPRKNIKMFFGKPMIAWSIKAAHETGLFDRIIVSSDDAEICNVAKTFGADTPFLRPKDLSDDFTGTTDVIAHATDWAVEEGWKLDSVCCLYATAPFVKPEDLIRGSNEMDSGCWDYTFSVTEFAAPIFRSFKITPRGGVEMFYPEHFEARSQDLPEAFHDAGQFYWGTPDSWLEKRRIFSEKSKGVRIPRWRVQDIDTNDDWDRAELLAPVLLG